MACGTLKHSVMFTGMPSSASVRVAARPSTIVGTFTTTFGAICGQLAAVADYLVARHGHALGGHRAVHDARRCA